MPRQKNRPQPNQSISFRPGALQKKRLAELVKLRQQNQTAVINAAIDLLWMFDVYPKKQDTPPTEDNT